MTSALAALGRRKYNRCGPRLYSVFSVIFCSFIVLVGYGPLGLLAAAMAVFIISAPSSIAAIDRTRSSSLRSDMRVWMEALLVITSL